jgi:CAAX protease family protein
MDSPFDRVRARELALILLMALSLDLLIFEGIGGPWQAVIEDAAGYALILFGLYGLCRIRGIKIEQLMGRTDESLSLPHLALSVVLPVIVLSFGTEWLVFWPLSYVLPTFVEWWLLDRGEVLLWEHGLLPLMPNAVNFLIGVALGPLCEEFLFRGLLLHRWSRKWGTKQAAILSSFAFGLCHADVLGAFLFGYVMCVLYLQTKTLLVPIAAHALNNMLAWNFAFVDSAINGTEQTLSQFQSEWWLGFGCVILSTPWLIRYLRENRPLSKWQLPYEANQVLG